MTSRAGNNQKRKFLLGTGAVAGEKIGQLRQRWLSRTLLAGRCSLLLYFQNHLNCAASASPQPCSMPHGGNFQTYYFPCQIRWGSAYALLALR